MNCQQCGRPATVRYTEKDRELFLCLDCSNKFEHAESLEFQRTVQQLNLVSAAFEAMSGLPGLIPRIPVPNVQIPAQNEMKINNINVKDSVIGVLNTGNIQTVETAVKVLRETDAADVATAISELTKAVIHSPEATTDFKNQIIEILSMVAAEAAVPKEKRRSAAVRPLLTEAATLFGGVAALAQLWQQYGATLTSFFR